MRVFHQMVLTTCVITQYCMVNFQVKNIIIFCPVRMVINVSGFGLTANYFNNKFKIFIIGGGTRGARGPQTPRFQILCFRSPLPPVFTRCNYIGKEQVDRYV